MVLTEYDEYVRNRKRGAFQGTGTSEPTGVLCPACGLEEVHANLQEIVDNEPPQHPAWCIACGWNGTV